MNPVSWKLAQHADIRAALFDIDGTLTSGGEVWGALIESPDVARFRKGWLYASAYPHYLLSKTGLVSQAKFRDRWVQLMAWLATGWSLAQIEALCETIVHQQLVPTLRDDVVDILNQHKAQGHRIVLVSTMFEGIVCEMARHLGADTGLGTALEMQNGRCTGRIVGLTCSGARKVDFARAYLEQSQTGISLDQCAAYADSRSDTPFLAGVGHPVATYPDTAMAQAARENGWTFYSGN